MFAGKKKQTCPSILKTLNLFKDKPLEMKQELLFTLINASVVVQTYTKKCSHVPQYITLHKTAAPFSCTRKVLYSCFTSCEDLCTFFFFYCSALCLFSI